MGRSHPDVRRSSRRGAESAKVSSERCRIRLMKLAELQRQMAAAIMQPLARADRQSPKSKVAYIKPNDRLTSLERVEIYSRSYWYRIIDSMYEDFPGLSAALGLRAFNKLVRAYLADCPSESYTLRNLGSRLWTW